MNWPIALLIVFSTAATCALVLMVRQWMREQAVAIAAATASHASCMIDLQRAHVAIARLHGLLSAQSGRRGMQVPPLDELFGDQSDDAMDRVTRIMQERAGTPAE